MMGEGVKKSDGNPFLGQAKFCGSKLSEEKKNNQCECTEEALTAETQRRGERRKIVKSFIRRCRGWTQKKLRAFLFN